MLIKIISVTIVNHIFLKNIIPLQLQNYALKNNNLSIIMSF